MEPVLIFIYTYVVGVIFGFGAAIISFFQQPLSLRKSLGIGGFIFGMIVLSLGSWITVGVFIYDNRKSRT